jgi:inhibitor of cysteine peptidase
MAKTKTHFRIPQPQKIKGATIMKNLRRHTSQTFILTIVLAAVLAIMGCNDSSSSSSAKAKSFESDEALTSYLKEQYASSAIPTPVRYYMMENAAPDTDAGADKGFSTTNLQEAGVDESDMVKTNGEYLFIANDSDVRIVSATPAESMNVVTYVKAGGWIDSIYLYESTLVVLYRPSNGGDDPIVYTDAEKIGVGMPYWIPYQEKTGMLIVDVSDPAEPETIKDIQVDGYLVNSRITGGNLHVVTQFLPNLPPMDIWYDGSKEDKEAVTEANNKTLESLTLDDFVPSYNVNDANGMVVEEGRAVETKDFIRPQEDSGGTMVSIITINMADPAADFTSTGFVADVQNIYASTESLYLVSTIYHYAEDTYDENGFVVWSNPTFETKIHKFDLGSTVTYAAEGKVDGEILNQFSLGEHNGVLRIATTTGYTWDGTSGNHVFCLENNSGNLDIIGSIKDLAPGERLYSARFMGDKGFLVTFVQVDPLFTLDLSDPRNPKVVGELKVPGFSTYLHPLNDNYLLAIGQDTKAEGDIVKIGGMQLSIFDISDFANPKLLNSEIIGDRGTYSEALYNHKAVAFWPEKNLLALPVNLNEIKNPDNPEDWGANTFNGLYVYHLTDEYDFELLGRINMFVWDETNINPDGIVGNWMYYPSWYRGVFIDDYVYSLTSYTVKAAPIDNIVEPYITLDLME